MHALSFMKASLCILHTEEGRSQHFCIGGVPNAVLLSRLTIERRRRFLLGGCWGVWGHAPPKEFLILGPQK